MEGRVEAVYASDAARMDSLVHAAEAISVWRFLRRRDALRAAGDPAAAVRRYEIEPGMAALRDAALAEGAKVDRDRRGLAETIAGLRREDGE